MSSFNKVILMGNLTRDPEVKHINNSSCVLNFNIGVNEKWHDKSGNLQENADFPNCVAWGRNALFIERYFSKGSKILIEGKVRTRKYQDDAGKSVYVTYILVEHANFAGGKSDVPRDPDRVSQTGGYSDSYPTAEQDAICPF